MAAITGVAPYYAQSIHQWSIHHPRAHLASRAADYRLSAVPIDVHDRILEQLGHSIRVACFAGPEQLGRLRRDLSVHTHLVPVMGGTTISSPETGPDQSPLWNALGTSKIADRMGRTYEYLSVLLLVAVALASVAQCTTRSCSDGLTQLQTLVVEDAQTSDLVHNCTRPLLWLPYKWVNHTQAVRYCHSQYCKALVAKLKQIPECTWAALPSDAPNNMLISQRVIQDCAPLEDTAN